MRLEAHRHILREAGKKVTGRPHSGEHSRATGGVWTDGRPREREHAMHRIGEECAAVQGTGTGGRPTCRG